MTLNIIIQNKIFPSQFPETSEDTYSMRLILLDYRNEDSDNWEIIEGRAPGLSIGLIKENDDYGNRLLNISDANGEVVFRNLTYGTKYQIDGSDNQSVFGYGNNEIYVTNNDGIYIDNVLVEDWTGEQMTYEEWIGDRKREEFPDTVYFDESTKTLTIVVYNYVIGG